MPILIFYSLQFSPHILPSVSQFSIFARITLRLSYCGVGQALLPPLKLRQKGLVPTTSGLSPLRDFHSIKFRPADIPVWLDACRERLLRAHGHYAFGSVAKEKSITGLRPSIPFHVIADQIGHPSSRVRSRLLSTPSEFPLPIVPNPQRKETLCLRDLHHHIPTVSY